MKRTGDHALGRSRGDRQEDMEIAGVAGSLDELRPILRDGAVEVLLLDLRLGDESGFDILRSEESPMPAVVVASRTELASRAIREGWLEGIG